MEAWYPIHDKYAVSDHGRVMRVVGGKRAQPGYLLVPKIITGYPRVRLTVACRSVDVYVHRLVACAVLGVCPLGQQVNHIDGDKLNNHASNLEYVTQSQNIRHAHRLNLIHPARGVGLPQAKLTDDKVRYARAAVARGETYSAVARALSVSPAAISHVASRKTWAHVH